MVDKKEIYRYLGYGKQTPDEITDALVEECILEAEKESNPKIVCQRYDIDCITEDSVSIAGININSKKFAKNLKGCKEVIIFAATLGAPFDRLLQRYMKIRITKAVIIQATGTALIEDFCNTWQYEMQQKLLKDKLFLRPRFSPGYGDFDIAHQREVLNLLNAYKMAGISLSEGNIMIPEKSVTAFAGISKYGYNCPKYGCESCTKANCAYRRTD